MKDTHWTEVNLNGCKPDHVERVLTVFGLYGEVLREPRTLMDRLRRRNRAWASLGCMTQDQLDRLQRDLAAVSK